MDIFFMVCVAEFICGILILSFWNIRKLSGKSPKTPLLLATLHVQKHVNKDWWNINQTEYHCDVLGDNKQYIGHFNYRPNIGQVGDIYVVPRFRHRMLEEQMLIYMMQDMQEVDENIIWQIYPEESKEWPNDIYNNLWNFEYKSQRELHPLATGAGYGMKIPDDLRTLRLEL